MNNLEFVLNAMKEFGFKKPDDSETARKRWYKFAGQTAKLSDYQVDALEFLLFDAYGEHIKLEEDILRNQQEIADEINEIGKDAFMKKYMEAK